MNILEKNQKHFHKNEIQKSVCRLIPINQELQKYDQTKQ